MQSQLQENRSALNTTVVVENGYIGARVLKINVGFIMAESIGFTRKMEFNIPSLLKVSDDLMVNHLYATLDLSHTGEGVLVRGNVETSIFDECSRCMDEVWIPIEFHIEELFARHATPELPYHIDEAGNIDLAPLIREEAMLHAPMMTPYDKHGRCLFCHRTWQEVLRDNGVVQDDIDPRFEALLKLRQQLEEDEE